MNAEEKNQIETQLATFRSLDLAEHFARWYPDQADLHAVRFGNNNYTAATFIAVSNQLVEALEDLLKSDVWHAVPRRYQIQGQPQNHQLNQSVERFVNMTQGGQLDHACTELDRLVNFVMSIGFWRRERKGSGTADVRSIEKQLNAATKRLDIQLETIQKASNDLDARRQDLTKFIEEKRSELGDVKRSMEEARKILDEIKGIAAQATAKDGEVSAIKAKADQLVTDLNIQLGIINKSLDEFKQSSGETAVQLGQDSNSAKKLVDDAKGILEFIQSKESDIVRLTGMAADASLGTKYNSRSVEISGALKWWRIAVPVSIALSIGWVIAVFLCFHTEGFGAYGNLAINLLKTAPAFVLMGFVISQYSKERNLREEYAFKSAVAMTINAYADILSEKDKPENLSRQQLILNALHQVHTPPKLHAEKNGRLFAWKAKDLREGLKSLEEAIRALKQN